METGSICIKITVMTVRILRIVLYNDLTATPTKEAVLLTNTWTVTARELMLWLIVVEEVTNWSINVEPLLSSSSISIPGTAPQGLKVMVTERMKLLSST